MNLKECEQLNQEYCYIQKGELMRILVLAEKMMAIYEDLGNWQTLESSFKKFLTKHRADSYLELAAKGMAIYAREVKD